MTSSAGREVRTPSEIARAIFDAVAARDPDGIVRFAADERTAVVQWRATGTFTGAPFLGVRATGRGVAFDGVDVFEIDDGLVRHATVHYDGATMARQIGLLPKQGSTSDRALTAAFNLRTRVTKIFKRS